jgi:hypothetical protein
MSGYVRLKLRVKTGTRDIERKDLEIREVAFGNNEKCIYVKDMQGNLIKFVPVNDESSGPNVMWSAEKISQEILNAAFVEQGALTLNVVEAPSTPDSDQIYMYVTSSGISPNNEIALKTKLPNGDEIIIASTLI